MNEFPPSNVADIFYSKSAENTLKGRSKGVWTALER